MTNDEWDDLMFNGWRLTASDEGEEAWIDLCSTEKSQT